MSHQSLVSMKVVLEGVVFTYCTELLSVCLRGNLRNVSNSSSVKIQLSAGWEYVPVDHLSYPYIVLLLIKKANHSMYFNTLCVVKVFKFHSHRNI